MMLLNSPTVITVLLVSLSILSALDLWKQYAIHNDDFSLAEYQKAMKKSDERSGHDFWKFGYRVEELEIKLEYQTQYLTAALNLIHSLKMTSHGSLKQ